MSVAQVPATRHTPGTACRTQAGVSVVFVMLASQVSIGEGAGLGPPPVIPPLWLIYMFLLAQVLAVRLSCLPASLSHASMEASAVLARVLGVG